ncbi:fumarylacetoacetate hydrolase family protein [Gordonia otitidis]|uniref:Fumarylacetoacetate hydrolase family protein n=1 Tax=Gordonia otitidis (strain DSM 44809 / CCUG 52243 / JCM 12355 / NBRC 100426 / IFM 10032) TaxID=1108044 RepID=H5TTI1_GORO1|nr:fumarylacetoacetate hydrolase family protein [Gordonia otitidis]GAB36789.1 fumarylacetoacetate hydrolase family protein [Gordonia otitidis NBRC 100426]
MRITNLRGRLTLLTDSGAVDVENASAGRFGSDPTAVYAQWDDFVAWADGADLPAGTAYDAADLGPVVPEPAQIFAIGLNYRDHATESGLDFPAEPPVFTKFRTSLAGPVGDLELPTDTVDWESELVVVIGRTARDVAAENAWEHVAGVTVGQDFSERTRQLVPPAPQFSLGKSFPGFSPIGPAVVTVDEFDDPSNLEIGCSIDGETMQHGRTGELIFSIPVLIERLSAVLPLLPGDLIFTGTPSGVGAGRNPKRFLRVGEEIVTHIEGIGELRQMCVPGKRHTTVSAS